MRLAAAGLVALAAVGCGDSSSEPAAPRVVPVLGAGSERATGFTVAPRRVVTVAHALPRGTSVRLQGASGRVVWRDSRTDLALLAAPRLRGAELETAAAKEGDSVRLLVLRGGRVAARSAKVRRAIEAHVRAPGASRAISRPALELEARLRAGDSGAPVLTDDGQLAGVLFARSRRHANTAYAVDAQAVEELLDAARR